MPLPEFLERPLRSASLILRELADFERLFDKQVGQWPVVFYSERDIYFQYMEGMVNHLLENTTVPVCYITSDPDDPVFARASKRFQPFFIRKMLPQTFAQMRAKLMVMTMPDLNQLGLKRSPQVENYIYKFHAMVSTHQQYRLGAFDHYDTVFGVGPYHIQEIRRSEEIYGTKPKTLVPAGYHRAEMIYEKHRKYVAAGAQGDRSQARILVAPTWGGTSIFETCIEELINTLGKMPHKVLIRPHPEFVKRKPQVVKKIQHQLNSLPQISLDTNLGSSDVIHESDVLITDRSGIAFEYAFGTERPVLFIDTPSKVLNPDCDKLGITPIEDLLRDQLGQRIAPDRIAAELPKGLEFVLSSQDEFRHTIGDVRSQTLFNWLKSTDVEAEYVKKVLGGD